MVNTPTSTPPAAPTVAWATLIAMATLLSACGDAPDGERYPARYQRALEATAPAAVPDDGAQRFVAFFQSLDRPGVGERVAALYGSPLYFSDTLFATEDRTLLARYFEHLQASGARVAVDLDDAVVSGPDLYLRWRMRVELPNDRTEVRTIGMTQLRFDAAGRIRFHQDFWDGAEGLYRHIPVLGSAIRYVDGRLAVQP